MSETKIGISQPERPGGGRADRDRGVDRMVVEHREPGQLGGEDLQVVPRRQLGPRHAHRGDLPVRAGEAAAGEVVDLRDERLLGGVLVRVVEEPVVDRQDAALRPHRLVRDELGLVEANLAVDDAEANLWIRSLGL